MTNCQIKILEFKVYKVYYIMDKTKKRESRDIRVYMSVFACLIRRQYNRRHAGLLKMDTPGD